MSEKEEYAERPVPQQARLGFTKPALVWAGFAYAYICVFIGSQIMAGLGAPLGYVAIVTGQIFLFVYSGLIAHKGAQYGLNFPLMCKAAFGKYGYAIPTLMIAGLVAGWFAFQAWLAADLMVGLHGGQSFYAGSGSVHVGHILPGILGETAFWAGVWAIVFGLFAVYGIKAMAWMGRFAVVSVTILAGWMIYSILNVVASGTGGNPFVSPIVGEPWTFALGFTSSIGTFIVSSTMTGDFTRWTKTPKQAWAVTAVAFPVFKNVSYFISKGRINFSWKKIALIVMFAGTAVAASNLLTSIVPWLLLLGTVVSLVGGVLIGHFWIVARRNTADELLAAADRRVNVPAIIGFIAGIAIAVPLVIFAPDIPSVIGGLIGGIVVYPVVAKIKGHSKRGRLTAKGIGGSVGQGTAAGTTNANQPDMPDSPSGSATASQVKDVNKKPDNTMDVERGQVR